MATGKKRAELENDELQIVTTNIARCDAALQSPSERAAK
jgi:hypothetical protein